MATPAALPKVPVKAWTVIRARAVAAPSTKFTPAAVAALLDMSSPKSAGDNIVYPLRRLGLLTEEDALTERGNKWRIDSTYADACQEILDEIYPDDLAALTNDDGSPDKARVTTWLQHAGFGGSNASQMAATYVLIASKTPPEAVVADAKRDGSRRRSATPAAKRADSGSKGSNQVQKPDPLDKKREDQSGSGPVVHLDIQIHIPATADADQIDQIFASMAKHLYNR